MKNYILFVTIATLTISGIAFGQSRCLTPEFHDAKIQLYEKFGEPEQRLRLETTDHVVGDTMTFWRWDLSIMPPAWILEPATCRAVTEFCYVFVANNQWNIHMDSADVEQVALYWEEETIADPTIGIYELDTQNFGPPPDMLDNDDHIYIFYSELGSFNGIIFDGYFSVFNEYTEEEAQALGGHSNEVEMFYMSCFPGDPVAPIRISVLAHEFEHMIHWGIDPDEEIWVDEGCAEYAMLLFGMPDPIVDFPQNPDDDLTVWDNQFLDYIQTFMFFTYVSDHYGGANTLTEIVAEQQNSTYGIENVLSNLGYSETFADLFVNWTITNYYHNIAEGLSSPDSQYIYYSIDPPQFSYAAHHTTWPAGPFNRNVNRWGTEYIVLDAEPPMNYGPDIVFEGNSVADWGLELIYAYTADSVAISQEEAINGIWNGGYYGVPFDYLVLGISDLGYGTSADYSYVIEQAIGIDEGQTTPTGFELLNCYPNPFNASTTIEYSLSQPGELSISIYNIRGQKVDMIFNGTKDAGKHSVTWNADNLPSGIYFARLETVNLGNSIKLLLIK
jgi:hypothetical protein